MQTHRCTGDWNLYCSNMSDANSSKFNLHSVFGNDECAPDYCCGNIVNESEPFFFCPSNLYQNVVCEHSVGLDIAVIASLVMAGIILFFFLFLFVRYIFRRMRKDELRKRFEKHKMESDKLKQKKSKPQKLKKIQKDKEPLLANDDGPNYNKEPIEASVQN